MAGWQEAMEDSRTVDSAQEERCQEARATGSGTLHLHVSLGVSGYPWAGDNIDAIVQWADTHMYAVKAAHKHAPA